MTSSQFTTVLEHTGHSVCTLHFLELACANNEEILHMSLKQLVRRRLSETLLILLWNDPALTLVPWLEVIIILGNDCLLLCYYSYLLSMECLFYLYFFIFFVLLKIKRFCVFWKPTTACFDFIIEIQ